MTGMLQAIVFDFDGVVADSERLHLLAYQDVLAPLDMRLDAETYYREYLGYDDTAMLRTYAKNNDLGWDDATIAQLTRNKTGKYEELSARGEMLFPGSAAFIRLAARHVPIAVASGALTREIESVLERAGLLGCFVSIVGADQTARSKPSPDPYLEAFARIEESAGRLLDPARTVAIEDSRWGLESAAAAGLRCVAVTNTYTAAELAPHAELVVSGLETLTLTALDTLCASPPASQRGASRGRGQP
jgi:beta-phosphoglucomutase-like phosphatase (HAD superfamily)